MSNFRDRFRRASLGVVDPRLSTDAEHNPESGDSPGEQSAPSQGLPTDTSYTVSS